MNTKYKTYYFFCAVVFFSSFLSGCKKEFFDPRNKYLGIWNFTVDRSKINIDSVGPYEYDKVYYTGKITQSSDPQEIKIQYTADNSITLKVYENGSLKNFPTHYCTGSFSSTKNLNLELRWGGLGGGIYHTVKGVKQE